jgi:hypothetical protein
VEALEKELGKRLLEKELRDKGTWAQYLLKDRTALKKKLPETEAQLAPVKQGGTTFNFNLKSLRKLKEIALLQNTLGKFSKSKKR